MNDKLEAESFVPGVETGKVDAEANKPYEDIMFPKNWQPCGPQRRPWLRFWARKFDLALFGLVCGFLWDATIGRTLNSYGIIIFFVACLFLYVFVEPIMLSMWGTTPGKALFYIRVRKSTGQEPSYFEAMSRTFNVLTRGMWLCIPLIELFACARAYNDLSKKGVTSWDRIGGFHVSHRRLGADQVVFVIIVHVVLLIVLAARKSVF